MTQYRNTTTGRIVTDPRTVVVDGHTVSNPGPTHMAAAGHEVYTPPVPAPPPTEAERQAAKPENLKAAENKLAVLLAPKGATPGMTADELLAILDAALLKDTGKAQSLAIRALILAKAVELRGGSWGDVAYHAELDK